MKTNAAVWAIILTSFLTVSTSPASACVGLDCLKKAIIPEPPSADEARKTAMKLVDAAKTGDPQKIKLATGALLLTNNMACPTCSGLAREVLPGLTDDQIQRIVGSGWLVFASTGSPILVVVDVANNVASEYSLDQDSPPILATPESARRKPKVFRAEPQCLIVKSGSVHAGWKSPPALIDQGGKRYQFPDVDLVPGDRIDAQATELCTQWKSKDVAVLKTATFRYQGNSTASTSSNVVKYFLRGSSSSQPVAAR
ncbi:hypothetical protein [Bradyrhizobium sp. ERR14]|uniref:hypothetical protein n=1 Tax=Bradyrhizobium sp. ERR14 TaxID=2663837 RepID=UPI001607E19A|nr:hypothetical protein [Bradyrhizobium sp. ERR14]MBB4391795.1 hypothetical protein [Bradyrhizobium sp. ERR14]